MIAQTDILAQVMVAKESTLKADEFICKYMPFIKSEASKFLGRAVVDGYDDEFSIALIGFHEAIKNYKEERGSFIKYASLVMRSRLLDYQRKEKKHETVSLNQPMDEEDNSLMDTLTDGKDYSSEHAHRIATKEEIEHLRIQLEEFGVSFSDVSDNCPKQERTMATCKRILQYAKDNPYLLDKLVATKKLPVGELSQGDVGVRKTIDRHRKYMVALLLIYTNGYEIIRGHLRAMMKGVAIK